MNLESPDTHSQIWHYFISYLLTCEVDLFEVLDIMAQMLHYIIFLATIVVWIKIVSESCVVFKLHELIDFSEYVLIQHLEPEAQAQV